MKKRDLQNLRVKAQTEIQALLTDIQKKLRDLKFDFAAGKLKNGREVAKVKKDIAQAQTVIRQMEIQNKK